MMKEVFKSELRRIEVSDTNHVIMSILYVLISV
jgi:hypothetical protein